MIAEHLETASLLMWSWLITYGLHSVVILALSLFILPHLPERATRLRIQILKIAMLSGFCTASIMVLFPEVSSSYVIILEAPSMTQSETFASTMGETITPAEGVVDAGVWTKKQVAASRSRIPISSRSVILAIWLTISGYLIARRIRTWRSFRNNLTRFKSPVSDGVREQFETIRKSYGLDRKVSIYCSDHLVCPVAPGNREIVVPSDFETVFSLEERQSIFAHELAHLKSNDPAWRKAGELICALFFFQPLNFIAIRYLKIESEYMADETALEKTNDVSALAHSLVKVASVLTFNRSLVIGTALASNRGSLTYRTMRIMNWERGHHGRRLGLLSTLIIISSISLIGWISPHARVSRIASPVSTEHTPIILAVSDTTLSTSVTWRDGRSYDANLDVTLTGYNSSEIKNKVEISMLWTDSNPPDIELKFVFQQVGPDTDSRPSAAKQLDDSEWLRTLVKQIVDVCGANGIDEVVDTYANSGDYHLSLIARQARS